MGNKLFRTAVGAKPRRSSFDLSYSKLLSAKMGLLYPVLMEEVCPGDFWKIGNEMVIRSMPLVTPAMHEINAYVHYFFVPYRILDSNWEGFITGGEDGLNAYTLPRWDGTPYVTEGGLWDYMGFPTAKYPTGAWPMAYTRYCYAQIWNDYYRDENLQAKVAFSNENILRRNWAKDYFTSALPFQQRGTSPGLPISGSAQALWGADVAVDNTEAFLTGEHDPVHSIHATFSTGNLSNINAGSIQDSGDSVLRLTNGHINQADIEDNTIDLSGLATVNVADLRLAYQTQVWMERNARCGVRYKEFLEAHYNAHLRDERLQRAEYVGGSFAPIIISEVLQTSKTDGSPQGNMAGHGISVNQTYCGSFYAPEWGIVMGLLSIMPKAMYSQGINRQWLRVSRYDFFTPEFANISEQEIKNAEIFVTDSNGTVNPDVFGFQGAFDEMRYKPNMIVGAMNSSPFYNWHLGRVFSSLPELNSSFIECLPDQRIFAVQNTDQFIVNFGNILHVTRPIPLIATPGGLT